jgi:PAS domain S-box-containing protein
MARRSGRGRMDGRTELNLGRNLAVALAIFTLGSVAMLAAEGNDYPALHLILDTSVFLASAVLALLLWDVGARTGQSFPRLLALVFAAVSVCELLHTLVVIEWSGHFAQIKQFSEWLRPATWGPQAYLLPVGIGGALMLARKNGRYAGWFALGLILLSVMLLSVFQWVPSYQPPGLLGITRPTLILVPLAWLAVGFACWRLRTQDRITRALAMMAVILFFTDTAMLYSEAPHDSAAMVAHLGKLMGRLFLLLSLVQMGSADMAQRIRVERELAQLNHELERRVLDRTAQYESANQSLEAEIGVRKQAEQALRESHERTRAIFDTALDGIITMDHDGRIAEFNPAAEQIFGYRRSEVIGQPLGDVIVPPALRERHRNGLKRYLATGEAPVLGKRIEITGLRADGTLVAVDLSINRMPGDGPPMFAGFLRDISERQHAEQVLRESQQLLQAIIDNSPAVIYVKSLDGRYLLVNRRFSDLFHFSKEAIVGKTDHDIFPKPAADAFRAVDQRVATAGHALTMEETAPQDDGPHTYISVKCPLWDNTGKIYAMFGISTDITDREHAAQRLRTQLERLSLLDQITRAIGERQDLRSIFQVVIGRLEDNLPIDFGCVCAHDPVQASLTVTCVGAKSEALARQLAMPEHTRINLDQNGLSRCVHGELVYEPDLAQVAFPFPQRLAQHGLRSLVMAPLQVESSVFGVLVAARREAHSFSSGDCEFLRQLGEQVALAAHQAQLYTALQQAYDELRQTQLAVAQQERLRALGQMASGIAHDINNALSPVALYTESLLEKEPNLSARGREYLKTIGRAIDDVAATVARMRESYRQREPQLSLAPVQLNHLVQQVVTFTRARWSDMPQQRGVVIEMVTELAPDLPSIMGVESEIREALTNLIFNAVDAMPVGGALTLRTGVAQSASNSTESPAPQRVDVEVIDTGVGMDEETRRRCLEPFFTTKGERGSGLGLAMVYGAVERHSAEIEIESTAGKGTTVRLSFAVPATVVDWPADRETIRAVPSHLRILVVDDDPLLLQSLRDTLETDGHLVVTANGGQAGIDAFRAARQGDGPFAVVITDLGMPYVDGRQVASAVKLASAFTPVILLTGWGQRLAAEGAVPPHVDRILGKPPKLRELREALAACCQPVGGVRGSRI